MQGMMNNCWFRVKIHPCWLEEGCIGVRFEHPTQPGNQKGGWMVKPKEAESSDDPSHAETRLPDGGDVKSIQTPAKPKIPMSEVKAHDTKESCWIVVRSKLRMGLGLGLELGMGLEMEMGMGMGMELGMGLEMELGMGLGMELEMLRVELIMWVYDCTAFLNKHPGGAQSILTNAGQDVTEDFYAIHSKSAIELLEQYFIGDLDVRRPDTSGLQPEQPPSPADGRTAAQVAVSRERTVALNPKEWVRIQLTEKEILTSNARRFQFALPSRTHVLGLPTGQHVYLKANVDGEQVIRPYTPISLDDDEGNTGYMDLVVRIYFKNEHPKFPQGGVFSQYLDSLRIGDLILVKGPIGNLKFFGRGWLQRQQMGTPLHFRRLSMVAGGTGITPIYQVIKSVLQDSDDSTEMALVYASHSVDDILLRKQLEQWAITYSAQFKLWFTVNRPPPEGWMFGSGFINERTLHSHLFPPDAETFALLCGPPGMLNVACIPNLQKLGYVNDRIICF
ncbi:hypothetical protein CBR_g36815 [Chara braunii]|uniref:Cytochrome-b5 reductase n=1 Tax=Chara braunii TaxID=69332 RepID=A0A388LLR8_CHABU|nr:hypothetical protein CBR_g36815 [Chara braunii]|eukprot:GBG83201.1 hypothetical protein CBR_g36815 [Chara braunii]